MLVSLKHNAITGTVANGAVAIGEATEADVKRDEEPARAAVLAWAAWWREARWRFNSRSAGPRWRGWREVEQVGGEGAGVQKMGILGIKYIGQIVFRRTVWAWKTRIICPIVRLLGNYFCKCSDSDVSNSPMVGQCCV